MGAMMGRDRIGALVLVATVVVAGCTGGVTDKAGEPVVLKMAEQGDLASDLAAADFVHRVRVLSHDAIRFDVVPGWGGGEPDAERQIVNDVAAGKADIGSVGTRVFDTVGIMSFQALTAPMLIDNYPLEKAVIASEVSGQMLGGLRKIGITGLALFGQAMRKPIGVDRALLGPADWRGIVFDTSLSRGQAAAVRALGATPTDMNGAALTDAMSKGEVQGVENSLHNYQRNEMEARTPYVTANVNLWPRTTALFINAERLSRLTPEQRGWLRQAADRAAANSTDLFDEDQPILPDICAQGARVANASAADLVALKRAFAPVYAAFEEDPQTKAFIDRIDALKRSTPPGPALEIPAGCTGSAVPPPGADPLTGIWRTGHLTESQVVRAYVAAGGTEQEGRAFFASLGTGAERYTVITLTFRHGDFESYQSSDGGPTLLADESTYRIVGNSLLSLGSGNCVERLRYDVTDGTLRLHMVKRCGQIDAALYGTFPFTRAASISSGP